MSAFYLVSLIAFKIVCNNVAYIGINIFLIRFEIFYSTTRSLRLKMNLYQTGKIYPSLRGYKKLSHGASVTEWLRQTTDSIPDPGLMGFL